MKTLNRTWRLKCGRWYVGLDGVTSVLVAAGDPRVQTFDHRDNRDLKRRFHTILLGLPLEVEEIDCEVSR
jgi:hypothetical protein